MDIATSRVNHLQSDNIADTITESASISQTSKSETLLRSDFSAAVCSSNNADSPPDGDLDSVNNASENRNIKPQVHGSNIAESSGELIKRRTGTIDSTKLMNVSDDTPSPAASLSNKERLLLRKRALSMKYRPVLAVGKSNVVTGVAKTINQHFKKYPLAIVNVKGRAKGTSVQEVVTQLEQATGSVLVSQEPSNVILYRGWGAEQHYDRRGKIVRKSVDVTAEAEAGPPGVSPELLAAIKLECGFLP